MPQLFDIETSILFQEGYKKGLEEGIKEAVEIQQIILIANMLLKTNMPVAKIRSLIKVEENFIQYIKENLASGEWKHPNTWTNEEWAIYFENKEL